MGPIVGVVTLSFNGAPMTERCLDHLERTEFPPEQLRLVVVDNGSTDGLADHLASTRPHVKFVRSGRNLGFAGGCNLGIAAVGDVDYVALVNNDAFVEPGWLLPLVDALASDSRAGAANPKVVFATSFVPVSISAPAAPPSPSDNRRLGVQVFRVESGGAGVTSGAQFASGFWGPERTGSAQAGDAFQWTSDEALLLAPVEERAVVRVLLGCGTGVKPVSLKTPGGTVNVEVGPTPTWVDLGPLEPSQDVINNVGTLLLADGSVADRGFHQLDRGQYDESREVFGWSGAAVLLSRRYLDDVGELDDRFFLYYEDTDLAWRGRRRGWRYLTVPASRVRHLHSGTVGESSALARHLSARNRLVALTKNAPPGMLGAALAGEARISGAALWHDVVVRLACRQPPVLGPLANRAHVVGGYLRLAPHALGERWRIRQRATVSARTIVRWAERRPGGSSTNRDDQKAKGHRLDAEETPVGEDLSTQDRELRRGQRVVVVMPAYNAAETLRMTWSGIPRTWVDNVILVDDHSLDETLAVAGQLPVEVIAHPRNIGYGGNQKTCYTEALRQQADVVVMLHPDGQYDPALIPSIIRPILADEADMVLGSRFMIRGGARKGGMPLYKFVSNRALTEIENLVLRRRFSELHTGYRAYSRAFLEAVPFTRNSDDFAFDTEVIAQAVAFGMRISEIPVSTKYFDEASSTTPRQSIVYGIKTLLTMARLLLHRTGWVSSRLFAP